MSNTVEVIIKGSNLADKPIAAVNKALGGLGKTAHGTTDLFTKLGSSMAKMGGAVATGALAGVVGIGAGLAGAVVSGLKFNNAVEQASARIMAFTKDAGATAGILEMVEKRAAETPFAFNEMADAVAALMPTSKQSGAALETLLEKAEILAASNPLEGLAGASFALKEAVSGDFTSIIERFNLSRGTLNELKAQGVPALEAVQIAMSELGLDTDLVTGLANTAAGRWSTFTDTLTGLVGTVTQPIFDTFSSGLGDVNGLLEKNAPKMESVAKAFAGLVKLTMGDGTGMIEIYRNLSEVIGTELAAKVTGAITKIQDVLADLAGGDTTSLLTALGLSPETVSTIQSVVSEIVSIVSSISLDELTGALTGIGVVVGAGVLTALAIGLASLLSPINLLIAGAAVLGAAWAGNWGNIQGIVGAAWATIQPILTELWTWLQTNIPVALQTLSGFWTSTLLPAITLAGAFIQSTVIPTLTNLWTWLQTSIPAAIQTLADFWTSTLQPAIEQVWNFISSNILPLFSGVLPNSMGFLSGTIDRLKEGFNQFLVNLQPIIPIVQQFAAQVMAAMPGLMTLGAYVGGALLNGLQFLAGVIGGVLVLAFETFAATLPMIGTVLTAVVSMASNLIGGLVTFVSGAVEMFVGLFTGDFDRARTGATQVLTGLVTAVTGILTGLGEIIGTVVKTGIDNFLALFDMMYQKLVGGSIVPDLVNDVVAWFLELPEKIMGAIGGLADMVGGIFEGLFGGAEGGAASTLFDPVTTLAGVQSVQAEFTNLATLVSSIATGVISAFQQAALTALATITAAITILTTQTLILLQTTWLTFTTLATQAMVLLLTTGIIPVDAALIVIIGSTLPTLLTTWVNAAVAMTTSLQPVKAMVEQINTLLQEMIALAKTAGEAVSSAMTKAAESFGKAASKVKDLIAVIKDAVTAFDKMASAAKAAASASSAAGATAPGGGKSGGGAGFASGTGSSGFTVPAGFPNDSFKIGLTSGEHFEVTPRGGAGERNSTTINNFTQIVNTQATTSTVISDFNVMRSLLGA